MEIIKKLFRKQKDKPSFNGDIDLWYGDDGWSKKITGYIINDKSYIDKLTGKVIYLVDVKITDKEFIKKFDIEIVEDCKYLSYDCYPGNDDFGFSEKGKYDHVCSLNGWYECS